MEGVIIVHTTYIFGDNMRIELERVGRIVVKMKVEQGKEVFQFGLLPLGSLCPTWKLETENGQTAKGPETKWRDTFPKQQYTPEQRASDTIMNSRK
jgi:hypothetical protein